MKPPPPTAPPGRPGRSCRLRFLPPVAAPLAIYLCVTFWNLSSPGLFYDECIDLTDSVTLSGKGGPHTLPSRYVTLDVAGRRLPLMRYVYTGPIKTYLFAAVFRFLPIRAATVRVITSLLGLGGLLLTYFFVKRFFGGLAAFFAVSLLATDITYVILNRTDRGPTAIMTVCKTGALFLFLLWWQGKKAWPLVAGAFMLGLGLSDKLNFLHFIAALSIASFLAGGKVLLVRLRRPATFGAALSFLIAAAPFFYFHAAFPSAFRQLWGESVSKQSTVFGEVSADPASNLRKIADLAGRTLSGRDELGWILGRHVATSWFPFVLALAWAILLIILVSPRRSDILNLRRVTFIAVIMAVILIALVATPHARFSNHFFMIYPFPHIFVAAVFAGAISRAFSRRRPLALAAAGALSVAIGLTVFSNLRGLFEFHREIAADRVDRHWSRQVDLLADFLRSRPSATAVCLDWGLYSNLGFLLRGEVRLEERLDLRPGDPGSLQNLWDLFLLPDAYYLFFAPGLEEAQFACVKEAFHEALGVCGYTAVKVSLPSVPQTRSIYEVVQVEPLPARRAAD